MFSEGYTKMHKGAQRCTKELKDAQGKFNRL